MSNTAGKPRTGKKKRVARTRGRPAADSQSSESIREEILEAAAEVYAQRGYHGASVERILKAAAVSRPTFYRYFGGRYDVLDVVIERVNDALRDGVIAAITSTNDVPRILERVVAAYFAWGKQIGSMAGPIYQEMHDRASPASAHRDRMLRDLLAIITSRANEGLDVTRDPLLFDAAIHVVEHIGHATFWPETLPTRILRERQATILTALRGMLLDSGGEGR